MSAPFPLHRLPPVKLPKTTHTQQNSIQLSVRAFLRNNDSLEFNEQCFNNTKINKIFEIVFFYSLTQKSGFWSMIQTIFHEKIF